jgi:hypothetical protein
MRALKGDSSMTTQTLLATGRTGSYRPAARARGNPATLIAVTLLFAVLIAEAAFLALHLPSAADLGPLAAVAGSMP